MSQVYEVLPGNTVEKCGGFIGTCSLESIEGRIAFDFDPDAGSAAITAWDVRIGGFSFPYTFAGPQLDDLTGMAQGTTLRFTHSSPVVDWTFTPIGTNPGDQLLWSGSYDMGCCDLFSFSFGRFPFVAPVSLGLVPEPSTVALLSAGFGALAARKRRGPRARRGNAA